jgi:ribosomal protein S27AE
MIRGNLVEFLTKDNDSISSCLGTDEDLSVEGFDDQGNEIEIYIDFNEVDFCSIFKIIDNDDSDNDDYKIITDTKVSNCPNCNSMATFSDVYGKWNYTCGLCGQQGSVNSLD